MVHGWTQLHTRIVSFSHVQYSQATQEGGERQRETERTHAIVREAPREGNPVLHHLLEQVLLVQKHEDRRVLEYRVLDHLLEQLQALVHPAGRRSVQKEKTKK